MSNRIFAVFFFVLFFQQCLFSESDESNYDSLHHYSQNVYSQRGEDGILQEILSRLNIENGFFVEFGAWDGIWFSNSRNLFEKGWSGVFIEADKRGYQALISNYKNEKNALCLNEFVAYEDEEKGKTIDAIADEYFPNQEIDFMSIDVDGADHLILEGLKRKPKILCIEGGFSWNPNFTKRVPDNIALQNLQQPLSVMIEIGRKQGYEPICFTQNTFFIRSDLYEPFKEIKNDPLTLWQEGFRNLPSETKNWLINHRKTHKIIRFFEGKEYLDLPL